MKIALAVVLAVALAAPAQARAPLTQASADQEVANFVADQLDGLYVDGDPAVTQAETDPCEILSSRRAECDGTFTYSNGDECDFFVTVRTTRRGHVTSDSEITWCDGDDD